MQREERERERGGRKTFLQGFALVLSIADISALSLIELQLSRLHRGADFYRDVLEEEDLSQRSFSLSRAGTGVEDQEFRRLYSNACNLSEIWRSGETHTKRLWPRREVKTSPSSSSEESGERERSHATVARGRQAVSLILMDVFGPLDVAKCLSLSDVAAERERGHSKDRYRGIQKH